MVKLVNTTDLKSVEH